MQNQEPKDRRNCLCSIVAVLIAEKLVEDGLLNAPLYRKQKKTGDTEIAFFTTSGYYDATNVSMLTENSRPLEESPIWHPSFISRESWNNAVEMFRYHYSIMYNVEHYLIPELGPQIECISGEELASVARQFLLDQGILGRPVRQLHGEETGEDVALDDTWNYADILWNGIQAEKVQRAFEKMNFREQTLLEKRLAICMTCGRVGSWKNRPTFEELAVMFEGSTASGAERAYRRAVDKLTELLVAEGAIHAVRLKQKSKTKRKKKIAAAIYEYQADCDGEWGEISLDFENGTAEIIRLADWDTMKTNRFANKAIAYLLNCENEKLPKETMVAFEL